MSLEVHKAHMQIAAQMFEADVDTEKHIWEQLGQLRANEMSL